MKRSIVCIIVTVVVLTGVKLWLFSGLSLGIDANSPHDDLLFINQADAILHGKWLGEYSNRTLAKGAFYPIFIALSHTLNIPLLLAQQVLYTIACFCASLLVWLLAKKAKIFMFIVMFTVLLFNPFSFDGNLNLRVNRPAIYYSLSLLAISSFAIATFLTRTKQKGYAQYVWAMMSGVFFACAWTTREESIWLAIPLCILGVDITIYSYLHRVGIRGLSTTLACLSMVVIGITPILILNKVYYGTYMLTESQNADFIAAYGALTRVKHDTDRIYVPVPKSVREKITSASPTWKIIDEQLEGYIYENWSTETKKNAPLDGNELDIGGGWFLWALRDAVADAGRYKTPKDALTTYRQIAKEINTACNLRTLDCMKKRNTFLPPFRYEHIAKIHMFTIDLFEQIFFFKNLHVFYDEIREPQQNYELIQKITLEYPRRVDVEDIRIKSINAIIVMYKTLFFPLFLLGVILYGVVIIRRRKELGHSNELPILLALYSAITGLSGIIVFLAATSLPIAVFSGYFGPIPPLLLVSMVIMLNTGCSRIHSK